MTTVSDYARLVAKIAVLKEIAEECPGTLASSFRTEQAMIILAGHRLRSHELPKCF